MIFMQRMKQLVAAVLASDADRVTRELLDQGVLHFVQVDELAPEWRSRLQAVSPRISEARIAEVRKRIESLLSLGAGLESRRSAPGAALDVSRMRPVDLDECTGFLDGVSAELEQIRDKQKNLQQEILKLEDIGRQLELFGDLETGLKAQSRFSFLVIQIGTIPAYHETALRDALRAYPTVMQVLRQQENGSTVLVISMKRDETQINPILDRFGWVDVEFDRDIFSVGGEVVHNLQAKLDSLRKEQRDLAEKSQAVIRREGERLADLWSNLRLNELYTRIQSYFSHTAQTMLFSGWVPAAKQQALDRGIRRATEGRCYLEWNDPEPEDVRAWGRVPVELTGPKLLSPFRMLVKNYAVPQYGTVNPTPFVAVAYLAMFGLMFGDAGHGLVLVLLGILGRFLFRRRGENLVNLSTLIAYCGAAAIAAGVLFGSYFGMRWFPPLWFDYHGVIFGGAAGGLVRDIYGVLEITIYFGIGVIGVGLLINWTNLVVQRKWLELLLDKTGIIGGWMYGAGVYLAMEFAGNGYRELPSGLLLVAVPAIILLFKPVLRHVIKRRAEGGERFGFFTLVDFFMEWIVEILEIASGYLANTLSFMRVAGLGIAHVSLMMAFDQIAQMVSPGAGTGVGGVLILILGNVLVIALEGLSAGIQSLRLNYYEFFSKYFTGRGIAYVPVNLKMRDTELSRKES